MSESEATDGDVTPWAGSETIDQEGPRDDTAAPEVPLLRWRTDPRTGDRTRHVAVGTVRVPPGSERRVVLDLYDEPVADLSHDDTSDLAATLTAALNLPPVEAPRRPWAVGDEVADHAAVRRLPAGTLLVGADGVRGLLDADGWIAWIRARDGATRWPATIRDLPDTTGGEQ